MFGLLAMDSARDAERVVQWFAVQSMVASIRPHGRRGLARSLA